MRFPGMLVLSLVMPACALPLAAQSSSLSTRVPLLGMVAPPSDWHTRVPGLVAPDGRAAVSRFDLNGIYQVRPPLGSYSVRPMFDRTRLMLEPPKPRLVAEETEMAPYPAINGPIELGTQPRVPESRVCYAMRSYRFAQEEPASDATRLKDYSTCQAVAQFHSKEIVGTAKVFVR